MPRLVADVADVRGWFDCRSGYDSAAIKCESTGVAISATEPPSPTLFFCARYHALPGIASSSDLKVDTKYGFALVTPLAVDCHDIAARHCCRRRAVIRASNEQRKRRHEPGRSSRSNRRFRSCGHTPPEARGVWQFRSPIQAGVALSRWTRSTTGRSPGLQMDEGRRRTKPRKRAIQPRKNVFGGTWRGAGCSCWQSLVAEGGIPRKRRSSQASRGAPGTARG